MQRPDMLDLGIPGSFCIVLIHSAGWPFHIIKVVKCCVSVCVDVNQGGTSRNRCTQRGSM